MELAAKRFADTVALYPVGRIDHATADSFKAALAPHLAGVAAGRDRAVIDLAGVEYISSVGLRVLMLASKQVKAQGGALAVADLQPVVREIFEISRFNLVLEVFPTLREALAKLSPAALAAFESA
ncbi:MAG TPA: STAS domain-containing protein [Methylomirabilota bacterium]|jgi:anti-anti-sigma factor|nr:STAS domain-containing protein [Methylomirabilota bacterium]